MEKGGQCYNKRGVDKREWRRGNDVPVEMYLAVLTNTPSALISLVVIAELQGWAAKAEGMAIIRFCRVKHPTRANVSGGVTERGGNGQISQGCNIDADPPRVFLNDWVLPTQLTEHSGDGRGVGVGVQVSCTQNIDHN